GGVTLGVTAGEPSVHTPFSIDTPFSQEGATFLRDLIAKTGRASESEPITAVEVARFRLLGDVIRVQGNDDQSIGAHDLNLLFAQRSSLTLGRRELFELTHGGLENLENTPLWHWYAALDGFRRPFLSITSVIQTPTQSTGALR